MTPEIAAEIVLEVAKRVDDNPPAEPSWNGKVNIPDEYVIEACQSRGVDARFFRLFSLAFAWWNDLLAWAENLDEYTPEAMAAYRARYADEFDDEDVLEEDLDEFAKRAGAVSRREAELVGLLAPDVTPCVGIDGLSCVAWAREGACPHVPEEKWIRRTPTDDETVRSVTDAP